MGTGQEVRSLRSPLHVHAIGEEIAGLGNRARGAAQVEHPDVSRFKTPIRCGTHEHAKD